MLTAFFSNDWADSLAHPAGVDLHETHVVIHSMSSSIAATHRDLHSGTVEHIWTAAFH